MILRVKESALQLVRLTEAYVLQQIMANSSTSPGSRFEKERAKKWKPSGNNSYHHNTT